MSFSNFVIKFSEEEINSLSLIEKKKKEIETLEEELGKYISIVKDGERKIDELIRDLCTELKEYCSIEGYEKPVIPGELDDLRNDLIDKNKEIEIIKKNIAEENTSLDKLKSHRIDEQKIIDQCIDTILGFYPIKCMICLEIGVPVIVTAFNCEARKGQRCNPVMCLSCTRDYFGLNKPMRDRNKASCPICRTKCSHIPKKADEVYYVDTRLMLMIDNAIDTIFSKYTEQTGDRIPKVFHCDRCNGKFEKLNHLWSHKRGDTGEYYGPCQESPVKCREYNCKNWDLRKNMSNGYCSHHSYY